MTKIVGRQTVCALAGDFVGTWRTARTVGAGDGQLILSDSLTAGHAIEALRDESVPIPFVEDVDTGLETISGDISTWLRYQGQELPIAMAMGAFQAKVAAGAPPYTMDINLATTLRGLFGTWCTLLESTIVSEVPSLKIHGFDLGADFGNPVTCDFHCTGNVRYLTGNANITNTVSDLAAVTIDDDAKQNRVVFNENSDFQINLEGDGALSTGDRLGIASFASTFDRPQDGFAVVNANDTGIEESIGSGFPALTFSITTPEMDAVDAVAMIEAYRTGATRKAFLSFSKGTNFHFYLKFPRLRVVGDSNPSITGPARIPVTITFDCLQATSVPAGMTSTSPFWIQTKNNEANDPW